jgi:hypothetical protein
LVGGFSSGDSDHIHGIASTTTIEERPSCSSELAQYQVERLYVVIAAAKSNQSSMDRVGTFTGGNYYTVSPAKLVSESILVTASGDDNNGSTFAVVSLAPPSSTIIQCDRNTALGA